jgi:hypothetical protein
LTPYLREMLEKMMAMAQVIKNLSTENDQLREARKGARYRSANQPFISILVGLLLIAEIYERDNSSSRSNVTSSAYSFIHSFIFINN